MYSNHDWTHDTAFKSFVDNTLNALNSASSATQEAIIQDYHEHLARWDQVDAFLTRQRRAVTEKSSGSWKQMNTAPGST